MCEESGGVPGVEGMGCDQEKLEAVMEAWRARVEAFGAACARAMETAILPMVAAVTRFVEVWMDALWETYREAGSPYGDDEGAMLRWVREELEIVDPPGGGVYPEVCGAPGGTTCSYCEDFPCSPDQVEEVGNV